MQSTQARLPPPGAESKVGTQDLCLPGEFYSDPPSRGETLPFLSFLSVDGVIRPVRLLGRYPQDGRDLLVGVCSDTQSCPTLCDSWTVA